MSLKAKIEAVIYASEEPVTLAQLIGLLGQEAQGELDRADSAQGSLSLNETEADLEAAAESDPTLDPETADTADSPTDAVLPGGPPELSQAAEPTDAESPIPPTNSVTPLATESPAPDEPSEPDSTALARAERTRLARLRAHFRTVLDALIADYATSDRGLEIREIAGGFRFATKPEYHDAVRGFVRSLKPPLKLSLQALETLAVVAYKQPVTAPEVSEVRGVDSAGVLGGLIGRKLVTTAGRKQVIGRPILYKTTKEFLLRFGLKDVDELPGIEEFERLASDLNEAVQEEIAMPEHLDQLRPGGPVGDAARNLEPMRGEHAAQADGLPDADADAEHLTPAPDAPGEFTGDETVPPADNAAIDGRISGIPPSYDQPEDGVDSPALDAEIQSSEERDTAEGISR